uniref:Ras-related protein Rab-21 n=1 Tax=Coccolithus braarudii TaxID=221442 RepID=A0A7S0PZI3_9EUKA|mmetsp:Transcript_17676/g.38120  ORF Transcript_17676/g.38120 Transcript_17676/m.38120 type:complete len:205 (+) Transcript_17676:111-725(+)
MQAPRKQAKVVLLGEGRVGKTSLVLRFCRDTFTDVQPPTVQASYLDKQVSVGDKRLNLAIWDTAGQERFHALGPIYYRDADAALLVFDITDTESFAKVKNWVRELRKMVGENIVIVIAGNKSDLERQRLVSQQTAAQYAESVGASYAETSAKTGRGIDDAFGLMARQLLHAGQLAPIEDGRVSRRRSLVADDADTPQRKAGACC